MRRCGTLLLLFVCGCGRGDVVEIVDVSGTVTYAGKPLEEGEIRFIPQEGTRGPITGGTIAAGAYSAKGPAGVPVGKVRVEITAERAPAGRKPDPNVPFTPTEQYLPSKYNTKSQLEMTILPGSKPISKDFVLTP